jgi:hypothetical protein
MDRAFSHDDILTFTDAAGSIIGRWRVALPTGRGRRAALISVDVGPDSGNNTNIGQPVPRDKPLKAACGL